MVEKSSVSRVFPIWVPGVANHAIHPQASALSLTDAVAHTLERAVAQHFCSNEILIKKNLIAKIIFIPPLYSSS